MTPTAHLSIEDALSLVKRCLENGGVKVSKHAWERLQERDFDLLDVRKAIRSGQIYSPPELDTKHGDWKYRVDGKSVDNRELVLIVCFKTELKTLVITIFPDN